MPDYGETEFEDSNQIDAPTIGDRINYPFIISRALLTFIYNATRSGDYDEDATASAAYTLKSLIPTSMETEEYRLAVAQATQEVTEDSREEWCGIKVGPQNASNTRKVVKYEPHKLLHACIDLLQSKNLLSKSIPLDKLVNKKPGLGEASLE